MASSSAARFQSRLRSGRRYHAAADVRAKPQSVHTPMGDCARKSSGLVSRVGSTPTLKCPPCGADAWEPNRRRRLRRWGVNEGGATSPRASLSPTPGPGATRFLYPRTWHTERRSGHIRVARLGPHWELRQAPLLGERGSRRRAPPGVQWPWAASPRGGGGAHGSSSVVSNRCWPARGCRCRVVPASSVRRHSSRQSGPLRLSPSAGLQTRGVPVRPSESP